MSSRSPKRKQAGDRLGAVDTDAVDHPVLVSARGAAHDRERNPFVEDGMQENAGAAHRMPQRPDSRRLDAVQCGKR